jgi:serine/threonine protein kinase
MQMEVARSIVDATSYLHSKKIVYRNLKVTNIGFDYKGVLKLFDFGFAIGLPEKDEMNPKGLLFDRCGTPRYMAPEMGLSLGYGTEADVYSFGVLFWEMCALEQPFSSITSVEGFERDVFIGGHRPALDPSWPTAAQDLLSCCWSTNPSRRPSMLDIKLSLSSAMPTVSTD